MNFHGDSKNRGGTLTANETFSLRSKLKRPVIIPLGRYKACAASSYNRLCARKISPTPPRTDYDYILFFSWTGLLHIVRALSRRFRHNWA